MIEKEDSALLLGPRLRRTIHRMTTPCGREGIAVRIGGILPHQEISGKPRLRHDRDLSRVAGNTSDASAATHRLKSIYESEGDAVKGPRSDEGYWR